MESMCNASMAEFLVEPAPLFTLSEIMLAASPAKSKVGIQPGN